jgi:hypothetical protein
MGLGIRPPMDETATVDAEAMMMMLAKMVPQLASQQK